MRIILTIQYDGSEFCGWQSQPNKRTVQDVIIDALYRLTGEKVCLIGSGRTDSGVHAFAQVAHFDIENSSIPPKKYAAALNGLLPDDVKVLSSEETSEEFHARFSAKRKTYRYAYYESNTVLPLKDRYAAKIYRNVDDKKMNDACAYFVGEHDFKCFLASNSSVKDTVREIYCAKVERIDNDLFFTVTGNGFLYNMVRIMAGTLLKVGDGTLNPSDVGRIIASGERKNAGNTMPARGLTLLSVEYK